MIDLQQRPNLDFLNGATIDSFTLSKFAVTLHGSMYIPDPVQWAIRFAEPISIGESDSIQSSNINLLDNITDGVLPLCAVLDECISGIDQEKCSLKIVVGKYVIISTWNEGLKSVIQIDCSTDTGNAWTTTIPDDFQEFELR